MLAITGVAPSTTPKDLMRSSRDRSIATRIHADVRTDHSAGETCQVDPLSTKTGAI